MTLLELPAGPNKRGYTGFVPVPFDYTTLAADVAGEARESEHKIKASQRDHIVDVGVELLRMKEKLAHGTFTAWVDMALNMKATTARNYMRVAREFASKPATVAGLPPGTLYRLAAAAPEVRNEIVARVEAGDLFDRDQVEDILAQRKAEASEAAKKLSKAGKHKRRENRKVCAEKSRKKFEAEERQREARELGAAGELVNTLIKNYDLDAINRLNKLWQTAGSHVVDRAVAAARDADTSSKEDGSVNGLVAPFVFDGGDA